jgi:hypothetical protein
MSVPFDPASLTDLLKNIQNAPVGMNPQRAQNMGLVANPPPAQPSMYPQPNQFSWTPPPQAQAMPPPHRPPPGKNYHNYLGFTRKMQFSYDTTLGGREYHRVYDFDISHATMRVDYVPFDKIFLGLQHAKDRFVAAFLMVNQRDCLSVITKQDMPPIVKHNGQYYVHLNFENGNGGYGGIPLVACQNETFTVRIITAEKTGTNFFMLVEGQDYQQPDITWKMQNTPFTFQVRWFGGNQPTPVSIVAGRFIGVNMLVWHPQLQGVPNLPAGGGRKRQRGGRDSPPPQRQQYAPVNRTQYEPEIRRPPPVEQKPAFFPMEAYDPAHQEYDPTTPYDPGNEYDPGLEACTSNEYDPTAPLHKDDEYGGGFFDK